MDNPDRRVSKTAEAQLEDPQQSGGGCERNPNLLPCLPTPVRLAACADSPCPRTLVAIYNSPVAQRRRTELGFNCHGQRIGAKPLAKLRARDRNGPRSAIDDG